MGPRLISATPNVLLCSAIFVGTLSAVLGLSTLGRLSGGGCRKKITIRELVGDRVKILESSTQSGSI